MHLLRIGAPGAEKPVARVDEDTYADLSDVVADVDESFFGCGGPDRVRPVVAERSAAGQVARYAGDLIDAGTPPGVGMGFDPPVRLQPGDVVELGITGPGAQRQAVVGPR